MIPVLVSNINKVVIRMISVFFDFFLYEFSQLGL